MILQSASRKEVRRIAIGSGICCAAEVAAFWLLSELGIGTFSYRVVTGALGGTLTGILNFVLMCLMIQKATEIDDEKLRKAQVRNSYSFRKLIQVLWIVAAFLIPGVSLLAAIVPLFFPNLVIYYLQMRGKLFPADATAERKPAAPSPASSEEEEEQEEDLGPFES